VSLESGILYTSHSYLADQGYDNNGSKRYDYQYATVPLLLRVSPLPLLSIAGGVFHSWGISTMAVSASAPDVSSSVKTGSKNNYGFLIGAGLKLPVAPFIKWRFDAFYEIGFANLSASSSYVEKSRNINVLTGVTLDLF
jgi:hypothetical protein